MPLVSRRLRVVGGWYALLGCLFSASWALAAEPVRDVASHGPFQLQATFPLGDLTPLFQDLSQLELELQRTLAVPPSQRSVNVYLFGDQRSHKAVLTQQYPRVPYRRALYVERGGQASVFAFRNPELPLDLRHECTHALLHASLPMVPLWLDEGLAEYFEVAPPERPSKNPHLGKLRWNLRLGMIRSIESLETCSDLSQMGAVEYRFAWAWTHFMLHGPLPAHRELVHYLADIRRGTPPGLLSQRLRTVLPDLDAQFVAHFKAWPQL